MTIFYRMSELIKKDIIKYSPLIIPIGTACIINKLIFNKICPFAIFTGLPCPGCGITRAFIYFIKLQWRQAFSMNPCIFIWIPVLIILFINRYLLYSVISPQIINRILVICGIISVIIYIIRMFTLYPDIEPMAYYHQNILHILISL